MRKTYSINGLAETLRCDRRTIKRALRDTPPVRHRGAIEYFALSDAVRALRQTKPNTARESLIQRKLLAQALRLEFDLESEKKEWHRDSKCGAFVAAFFGQQKTFIRQKLENELPVELVGLDHPAIRQKMRDFVDAFCVGMQQFTDSYAATLSPETRKDYDQNPTENPTPRIQNPDLAGTNQDPPHRD